MKQPGSAIDGELAAYHDEVVGALLEIGDPALGAHVAQDRGSRLLHMGIRFPALRQRVKQGFSFYGRTDDEVLAIWDLLWQTSPYGDVLFAALEYYLPRAKKGNVPGLWPVAKGWVDRVDNWCHSDMLSSLYSHLLASDSDVVYPQLEVWNRSDNEWLRRVSLVSLIHYSGKNAVFLPPERVLPMVATCVDDHRYYVELAVGWVLREMGNAYPAEVTRFIEQHSAAMTARTFSRAIERRAPGERARLRRLRKETS